MLQYTKWDTCRRLAVASNLLTIGHTTNAKQYLVQIMPQIVKMTQTRSARTLFAECCKLFCRTDIQLQQHDNARTWLRSAMNAEELSANYENLTKSLHLDAQILNNQGRYKLAKESLMEAIHTMMRYQSQPCLQYKIVVDLAKTEVKLNQCNEARERLTAILPALRQQKRNYYCAHLLPIAASTLSLITAPKRRLRRKTMPETIEYHVKEEVP